VPHVGRIDWHGRDQHHVGECIVALAKGVDLVYHLGHVGEVDVEGVVKGEGDFEVVCGCCRVVCYLSAGCVTGRAMKQ
jgi:hypothetical protein